MFKVGVMILLVFCAVMSVVDLASGKYALSGLMLLCVILNATTLSLIDR